MVCQVSKLPLYIGRDIHLYVANGLVSLYVLHVHQYLNSHTEQGPGYAFVLFTTICGLRHMRYLAEYSIQYFLYGVGSRVLPYNNVCIVGEIQSRI
jgi:hypothetical protein